VSNNSSNNNNNNTGVQSVMIDLEKSVGNDDPRGILRGSVDDDDRRSATLSSGADRAVNSYSGFGLLLSGGGYDDTRMVGGSTHQGILVACGAVYLLALLVVWVVSSRDHMALLLAFAVCSAMLGFALLLTRMILQSPGGSLAMRAVSEPIREGAEAFFATQYTAIAKIAGVVSATLVFLYLLRPPTFGVPTTLLALLVGVSFLLGAACSAFAGFVGLWVSSVAVLVGEGRGRGGVCVCVCAC
jgi:hypothetical protein